MNETNPTHPRPEEQGQSNENIGEEQMQAMSMLGGAARPEGLPQADDADFAGVDESRAPSISQSTILVVVVLVVAVGSLYAMRLTQGDIAAKGSSQIEAKIEQALVKLSNPQTMDEDHPLRKESLQALFQDTDEIISTLEVDLSGRQVPSDQIKKNPFQLALDKKKPVNVGDGQRQAQLEKLRSDLNRFKLQSVMGGGSNLIAVIDGEFYEVGQSIGEFRITSIDGARSAVELSAAGHTFTLTMDD